MKNQTVDYMDFYKHPIRFLIKALSNALTLPLAIIDVIIILIIIFLMNIGVVNLNLFSFATYISTLLSSMALTLSILGANIGLLQKYFSKIEREQILATLSQYMFVVFLFCLNLIYSLICSVIDPKQVSIYIYNILKLISISLFIFGVSCLWNLSKSLIQNHYNMSEISKLEEKYNEK